MRSGWIGVLVSPQGDNCSVDSEIEHLSGALRSPGYVLWESRVDTSSIVEPWEHRSYELGAKGPYAIVHPTRGPAPDKIALKISEMYPDHAVVLYMPELFDEVPGLGRVPRGGPDGAEVLKIYLDARPELKVGRAADQEVAYPVPEVTAERAPLVLQKLRNALGVYHGALSETILSGLTGKYLSCQDAIRAISFPAKCPPCAHIVDLVHRDAPLARNSP